MSQLNFDATTVSPSESIEAIPAGWYNAQIDQSEMKPTKDGSGAYLELRFSVLDGQYANRKVYTRLNVRNNNPVAQEIAYKQLSAICHATGVLRVQDSQQLHGLPLKIKVKVRAASGDYEASNEISSFKNVNEQVTGPVGGAPASAGGAPWAPAAPAWQPPAAQQPWAQQPAPQAAPVQQPAPQPQAAPQPAGAVPPWMQQAAAPADGAVPPWAAPQQ